MKERARSLFIKMFIVLALGTVYVLLWRFGLDLKCPLHELTGLLCPGCGISRMLVSLARLDFTAAAHYNLAGLLLLPLWLAIGISRCCEYIKYGTKTGKAWYKAIFIISTAVFVLYGILRNLTDLGLSGADNSEFFK